MSTLKSVVTSLQTLSPVGTGLGKGGFGRALTSIHNGGKNVAHRLRHLSTQGRKDLARVSERLKNTKGGAGAVVQAGGDLKHVAEHAAKISTSTPNTPQR